MLKLIMGKYNTNSGAKRVMMGNSFSQNTPPTVQTGTKKTTNALASRIFMKCLEINKPRAQKVTPFWR